MAKLANVWMLYNFIADILSQAPIPSSYNDSHVENDFNIKHKALWETLRLCDHGVVSLLYCILYLFLMFLFLFHILLNIKHKPYKK